jgi:DNA polymerase II small subunit/DNA polymerase delta subunit B
MTDTNDYPTKSDVEEIVTRVVGNVVGEIVGDALQLINDRFDRLERRVNEIADIVDHHTIDIRELQRKVSPTL